MPLRFAGLIPAEGVALDAITNRLTIFNVIENVITPSFPAALPRLMVVVLYDHDGAGETLHERVLIHAPAGEVLALSETVIAPPDIRPDGQEANVHRSIHAIWALVFRIPGAYKVELQHRGATEEVWKTICTRRIFARTDKAYPFFAEPKSRDSGPNEESPGPESTTTEPGT